MLRIHQAIRFAGSSSSRTWQWVLILPMILCLLPAIATAAIDVNESHLHGDQTVYGLNAATTPVPYLNDQDITLWAWGETDPSLYANVGFYAYGLFSAVDLANGGAVDVNAVGGNAGPTSRAWAWVVACGVCGDQGVDNTGAVTVAATGGEAETSDEAVATALAFGIDIGSNAYANNSATVTVSAIGGTASADGADTRAYAYGIVARSGTDLDNSGDVAVSAQGGTPSGARESASADAVGLTANGGRVDNSGDLSVRATGGLADTAEANADGISAGGADLTNSGDIIVIAEGGTDAGSVGGDSGFADAEGRGIRTGNSVSSNSGAIAVTATGGTTTANTSKASAYARARGVTVSYGALTSTGDVAVTCNGGVATSIEGWSDAFVEGTAVWAYDASANTDGTIMMVANGGSATSPGEATAKVLAQGICAEPSRHPDDAPDSVSNSGAVSVVAYGGTAASANEDAFTSMTVEGIHGLDADIVNLGTIDAVAHGGTATSTSEDAFAGVSVYGIRGLDAEVANLGAIDVVAHGGMASANAGLADATTSGCGILSTDSNLINRGAITATVTGGTATGVVARANAHANGIHSYRGNIVNLGDITVTAQAAEGFTSRACGISQGYRGSGGFLTNTGVIRLSGDTCYEVYVGGDSTLLDIYNVTLDGDPGNANFYVKDHANLALNDATLTVTAVAGETLWDTPYELFETEGTGAVIGSFGAVEAIHPATTAVYDTQGTTEASDDTVSLSYAPRSSEATASAAVSQHLVTRSLNVVNRHLTNTVLQSIFSGGTSGLLADAGPTARSMALAQSATEQSQSGFFVEPYYSTMEHDANPLGYDARLWGFAAGYERQMDNTLIGLHVGYGQADVDYTGAGFSGNSEDQDILTAGVNALTRWDDWTLRYGLTGFYGSHDYRGLTGLSLDETEKGSTDSYGLMASVMAGRVFQRGAHVFLPEVGVNYIWGHRQRYTTDASDPAWDTTYSAIDDHDLQAEASLNWLCGFMHNDMHVLPSASIGVRHLLTDSESSVSQSVAGAAPVSVASERDRTALTLAGSVTLRKARHSLSLAYDGEYSPDTERHSLWLRYGWQF